MEKQDDSFVDDFDYPMNDSAQEVKPEIAEFVIKD